MATVLRSRFSYHRRLFLLLLAFSWALVACFVTFQYSREKRFKAERLDARLQLFNLRLLDENDERVEGASYSVKDTTVCTADGSKITGKASGVTRVTVTYYGESFECIIRVK